MRLPILMYHQISDTPSAVSVSPAALRQHLARLKAARYTVVPLSEALERPAGEERLAVLTFDDGCHSVYQQALPLLAAYGWRATVFPVVDYVGRANDWP